MSKSDLNADPVEVQLARERTAQVHAVGWTAGVSAFFIVGALTTNPTWPVATGAGAVAAMIAIVCCVMLKRGECSRKRAGEGTREGF